MSHESQTTTPLEDRKAHEIAMSLPIEAVVKELVEILGLSLVAAIAGVSETRAVNQWMAGRAPQRPQTLRFALQIALMISESVDGSLARAWFQGSNPQLADRPPALMLRTLPLEEVQE